MGAVGSKVSRSTIQKINVENRAHRVIEKAEKHKPAVAPKHATTEEALKKIQKDHPEWLDAQKMKHEGLHDRLRGMVVTPDKFGEVKTKRSLPESRQQIEDQEFGYLEPTYIRPGHCSIRQSLEFISQHIENPQTYTADRVAADYNLDQQAASDILKYFQTFQIQLPKELLEKLGPGATAGDPGLLKKPDSAKLGPGGERPS